VTSEMIKFIQKRCWRIIPSRYPPINLFERVASSEDLESIAEIENLTNDRLRAEIGELSLVAKEDRITGPGSSFIMAAFTHLNPEGSRFSDGTWGVYYASLELETSIAETKYHRENFFKYTNEGPIHLDMRVLISNINADLHDLTLKKYQNSGIYDANDYSYSQKIARSLREEGADGLYYKSVHRKEGKNVAIFKPRVLSNCLQERHLEYVWDGKEISSIFEKKLIYTPS
jgi:hypothetical protein